MAAWSEPVEDGWREAGGVTSLLGLLGYAAPPLAILLELPPAIRAACIWAGDLAVLFALLRLFALEAGNPVSACDGSDRS